MVEVKEQTIGDKEWKQVEEYIKGELKKRRTDSFRKEHERIWKEVDRQISMQSMKVLRPKDQKVNDWHSAIELGELARASEIITADVRRLIFPNTRAWFEAHVELPPDLDEETGRRVIDGKRQESEDGKLRALMAQQHMDFGFKSRFELSVKESLHHGSFVSEARLESAMLVKNGTSIKNWSAPVWVPHSMWNCYPDPSPSIMGTNMFYNGAMIIVEYVPLYHLKMMAAGPSAVQMGWMPAQLPKIPKRGNKNKDVDTQDIELIKYLGDICIKKSEGDIFLPNCRVILANDIIVYYAPNSLPFSPVIYNGYERMDVRDPYYVSPLIKLSPTHKIATVLANKFLDSVALKTEPPILYDGNDPSFVKNGGPTIAPGWKGPTKGSAKYETIDAGDPQAALAGLQLALDQLRQGTSVDALRAGGGENTDKTATEIRTKAAKGEIRVVDFVDKLEYSLKSFLYMQHEINKASLEQYSFYNQEMDSPDFMWVTKDDLPQNVHFDIVGARGVLGEEERAQKMTAVTAFASGNPLFAKLIKPQDLLIEMYQDAGVKNPERLLNVTDELAQVEERVRDEFSQALEENEREILDLQKQLAISRAVNEARVTEATIKATVQAEITEFKASIEAALAILKENVKPDKAA